MLLCQGNSTYDTEADKSRLRNIWHDNKQDGMLRGEKLWQIILHRLRLQTQCWIALHLYRRKPEKPKSRNQRYIRR